MMSLSLPAFPVEGGCLCGAVRYAVKASPLTVYNCHCKDCRRTSGAAYTMSMPADRRHVALLKGELVDYDKRADSGRIIRMRGCPHCGVRVWNEPQSFPDIFVVKPGTLDDMGWAVPIGNIWTNSRCPWIEIDPALVNFEAQPLSREPLYERWRMVTRSPTT